MTDKNVNSVVESFVLKHSKEGNIVIRNQEGLETFNLDDFINQPAEGILYDLNRDRATTLSLIKTDPKWVNDYAVALVIEKLKSIINDLHIETLANKEIIDFARLSITEQASIINSLRSQLATCLDTLHKDANRND